MAIPEILKGEVHLPLTESMLLSEALPLANAFYQVDLNVDAFVNSQAFVTPEGKLVLEAIDKATGVVQVLFVNKNMATASPVLNTLVHPLLLNGGEIPWLGAPVQVDSAAELEFLDKLGSGNTYPTLRDNSLAYELSLLLNQYNAVGHWKCSTFSAYSTAGFELVYKGPSDEAPAEYLVGDSEMLAIIRFHHGQQKGMLCLKS